MNMNLPISYEDITDLLPTPVHVERSPWNFYIDQSVEMTDNVTSRSTELLTPTTVDNIRDARLMTRGYSGYSFISNEAMSLNASYGLTLSRHNDAKEQNLISHVGSISLAFLGEMIDYGATGEVSYSYLDNHDSNAYRSVSPWLTIRESDKTDTTLTYSFVDKNSFGNFKGTSVPQQSKADAQSMSVGITQRFLFPENDIITSIGFVGTDESSKGIDNEYLSYRPYASIDLPLFYKLRNSTSVSFTKNRYKKLSTVVGSLRKRDDNNLSISTNLYYPLTDKVRLYGGYTFTKADSNIQNYDYKENMGKAGIVWYF